MQSYKDLIVWQKSKLLSVQIYELTEQFPQSEIFCLTSQVRRSAISIAANIAEGSRRGTRKDFRNFVSIAYGSGAELESHIEIVKELSFGRKLKFEQLESTLGEVMKMLNALHSSLQK